MDFSIKYITMCMKAKEIQKSKDDIITKSNEFSYLLLDRSVVSSMVHFRFVSYTGFYDKDIYIFLEKLPLSFFKEKGIAKGILLPTQAQLQELLIEKYKEEIPKQVLFLNMYKSFNMWLQEYAFFFNSAEKLWLAFTMHFKYGKVWSNDNLEKWVKSKKEKRS